MPSESITLHLKLEVITGVWSDKIPHQIKLEFHKQTVCVVDAFAEKCFIKH